jgi:biopolymer transport protein ExbB/TolQ
MTEIAYAIIAATGFFMVAGALLYVTIHKLEELDRQTDEYSQARSPAKWKERSEREEQAKRDALAVSRAMKAAAVERHEVIDWEWDVKKQQWVKLSDMQNKAAAQEAAGSVGSRQVSSGVGVPVSSEAGAEVGGSPTTAPKDTPTPTKVVR